ncbi:MAG TPA: transcription elongation factor GreA [Firmicutes bacterium]|jgi:transcription elongation factor GreA|nr:transcription elongation factor GreA [Bacillota bacterium]HAV20118.1 transcription elongation factor GreA [Bacillota bacterium]
MELEKVILTREGAEKLNSELRHLIDNVRPEVIEQLAFARSLGDLSENADYDAAKARQADVELRIRQLEDILQGATIVDNATTSSKVVTFGRTVTIKHLGNNKVMIYQIVGTHETSPSENTISNVSPLGIAIMGGHVGDVALVKAPKPYSVEIIKIE